MNVRSRTVMGNYFNPGNESFAKDRNYEIYVDKTNLLNFLNKKLLTPKNCIALSHARRFGKSLAAGMIKAYYSKGCDSSKIFEGTKIASKPDYQIHLNKYNVIHLDISTFFDSYKSQIIEKIVEYIYREFKEVFGNQLNYKDNFSYTLLTIYNKTKTPFVIIMDEWDCVIRNSEDDELVHKYLQFLRAIFKSEESKSFLALGYITGILPIKKIEDESALNNFREYTMLRSYPITEYYGFTEDEVKALCIQYDMDYDSMRSWYNGYLMDEEHMFNPYSIVEAIENREFSSYWKNTSAFESIGKFITLNYEGLKNDVMNILAGDKVNINTQSFSNDFHSISSKNEALTALIHLGYLAYNAKEGYAYIPNYEVKEAFQLCLEKGIWSEISKSIGKCDEILRATINKEAERVAELLELAHDTYSSALKYNDENSLSCVLTMAYFTAPAYYNVIREFPAGKGFADFAFIPRANAGTRPAMIIELKHDRSADTAIKQIKEKRYAGALKGYSGKILLVGVNYRSSGEDKKKHTCVIEEYQE